MTLMVGGPNSNIRYISLIDSFSDVFVPWHCTNYLPLLTNRLLIPLPSPHFPKATGTCLNGSAQLRAPRRPSVSPAGVSSATHKSIFADLRRTCLQNHNSLPVQLSLCRASNSVWYPVLPP